MTAKQWKAKIKRNCKAVGTYKKEFDPVIDTLASILEKRDNAEEQFVRSGSRAIVKHTNKAGAENLEQNPVLRIINDLNRDSLTYWRELGLTAAALKKINEAAIKNGTELSVLDRALIELGG